MIIVVLLVLGLCFGSFVNALVWRLHSQDGSKSKKAKTKASKDMSIISGRSMCTHCKHPLAAKDLVPVVSWLMQGGKCRYCHKKIEDSPLTELATALLFVFSYTYWPYGFSDPSNRGVVLFTIWLVFLVGFMAMVVYDLRWYLLPNKLVYPLLGLALIQVLLVATVFHGDANSLREAFFGLLVGGGIFYLLFQISGGKWIGGGDVKLGAVIGLIVGGPLASLLLLFTASCLGSLTAIPMLLAGKAKRDTRLPFGPFLITATIIVYLFGASMIGWYKRQTGL